MYQAFLDSLLLFWSTNRTNVGTSTAFDALIRIYNKSFVTLTYARYWTFAFTSTATYTIFSYKICHKKTSLYLILWKSTKTIPPRNYTTKLFFVKCFLFLKKQTTLWLIFKVNATHKRKNIERMNNIVQSKH